MEGDHSVIEKMLLPLGNVLEHTVFLRRDRQVSEMLADKVPDAVLGACGEFEPVFKAAVGFVCGDDEVFINGILIIMHLLIECTLSFIENTNICNNEPCFLQ